MMCLFGSKVLYVFYYYKLNMKKFLIFLACVFLAFPLHPLYSQQSETNAAPSSSTSWQLLEQQSQDLLAGIQKQDTHPLHLLDAAIENETGELSSQGAALSAEKKQLYGNGLKKLAELAHDIHMDGHQKLWDDALRKQMEFVRVLKKTEALLPNSGNSA